MKKLFTLLALAITLIVSAQAPQGFNYQATVRNSAGALITNQNVLFKFNIMLNSQTSLPVYSETHQAPTDDLGQVNLVIGTGTATTTGSFSAINWGTGNYYLSIELNTGTGYVAMGTTQLLSVPYALYANSAGSTQSQGKQSIYLTGNITNAQAAAKLATELGPDTENIYIRNTTQLTNVDLSSLVTAVQISIENNVALANVNLNGLTTVFEKFYVNYNPLLNLATTSLADCYELRVSTISSLNISGLLRSNDISVSNITNFTGLSNLVNCETLNIDGMNNTGSLNFSSLVSANSISIYSNPSLTSLALPMLTSCNNINFNENKLPSSVINTLLNKFLTVAPATGKSIGLGGQTPPAPPTDQGIIDKQTLINAGNGVYTDEFVPTVTTTAVTSITSITATSGGNVTNSGGATITTRGVVWSTSNEPTIESEIGMTTNDSGEGVFTSSLTGLSPGTTYYVRAYATNSSGTGYGNIITFTTTAILPTLTTSSATRITFTSTSSGGYITYDGGSSILSKGVCWSSSSSSPTIALSTKTSDGSGEGVFTSSLTGLSPGTTYYVRAYATNSIGTAYGSVVSFNTLAGVSSLSVTIGNQTWMTKNLDVTTYSDGTVIPQVTDPTAWGNLTTGAWCYNNNDSANGTTYGKLYNWYAVAGIWNEASKTDVSQRKKLAPAGWHVPTDIEWTILIQYLDPNADGITANNIAGGKLKLTGTIEDGTGLWHSPNINATNESGFFGLPAGYRSDSFLAAFNEFGTSGNWWSSSEYNTESVLYRTLVSVFSHAARSFMDKAYGLSVRCIKD
jgi:uncharacterized protein (TIGR02145 family)